MGSNENLQQSEGGDGQCAICGGGRDKPTVQENTYNLGRNGEGRSRESLLNIIKSCMYLAHYE